MKAYVLIDVSAEKPKAVLNGVRRVKGVESCEAVAGPHDLIAVVEGEDINEIAKVVVERIRKVKGVAKTLTCFVVEI